jgi:glycosyltransferase involved in cell wall biosynthesis
MGIHKVLHVIPSVGPLRGGPSTTVRQLAIGLTQAGVETHIATTNDNGPDTLGVTLGKPIEQEGVIYWYFPRQTCFYTFSWPLTLWLARHIGDYDVVHIHALFSYAPVSAAYLAQRKGVPYVVRPLGTLNRWGMVKRRRWLKRASFALVESRVVKHASLIHYTSRQEQDEAESLGIGTSGVVIPNPLAPVSELSHPGAFRRQHPSLQDRPIVLFVSRLDPKKGLDLLLHAWVEVRSRVPPAVLVIAGQGDEDFVRELKTLAKELRIEADLVWVGFVQGEEKQSLLMDADVFVLPSYSENFGIAVAEAMASGLPVVISNAVGLSEDVAQGAGIVVPCAATPLAQALLQLLGDPSLRQSMGAAGRTIAIARYARSGVTRRLLDAYTRLDGHRPELAATVAVN